MVPDIIPVDCEVTPRRIQLIDCCFRGGWSGIWILSGEPHCIRGLWAKGDKRAHLNCNEWTCASYRILRELHNRGVGQSKAIMWPEYYDREIVKEAVELVVMEANKRAICRQTLPLEADGIEMR
ncbi:DDE superfamily endonuclease [Hirsutella rhossiliensis]